jgi:hypothetical protein
MATNNPSLPTAEAGNTTSEYQVTLGAIATEAIGFGVQVISDHTHWLTTDELTGLRVLLGAVAALAIGYAVSRGVRKSGTQG